MGKFKESDTAKSSNDKKGRVYIKIILGTPGNESFPVAGNRKESIIIADATVGEVYDSIREALLGDD